jgi:hypothetical protein
MKERRREDDQLAEQRREGTETARRGKEAVNLLFQSLQDEMER